MGIVLSATQSQRLFEIGICFGEIALPEAGKTQVAAGHGRFDLAIFDLRFAEEPLRNLPSQTHFATGGATQPLAVIGEPRACPSRAHCSLHRQHRKLKLPAEFDDGFGGAQRGCGVATQHFEVRLQKIGIGQGRLVSGFGGTRDRVVAAPAPSVASAS